MVSMLTLLLLNVRSVQNKSQLIADLINDEGVDLACIMETWANAEGGVAVSQICSTITVFTIRADWRVRKVGLPLYLKILSRLV